jgi:predicted dithiol-disulfide oxidoreductase (DUF899 family)
MQSKMNRPKVVSQEEWSDARRKLLVKEKEATRARDVLAAERRRLPWVRIDKKYVFEGPDGEVGLLDLFGDHCQLIVYRFFFQPDVKGWPDTGCEGCSMFTDNVGNFVLPHLNARDTTLALVSPAPQANIKRFGKRMGWEIPWFTSVDDFSRDFDVAEWFGLNVFFRDGEQIFRTYFTNGRAVDAIANVWSFLDITALGRQETWEDSPEGYPQTPPYDWWRLRDEYNK